MLEECWVVTIFKFIGVPKYVYLKNFSLIAYNFSIKLIFFCIFGGFLKELCIRLSEKFEKLLK